MTNSKTTIDPAYSKGMLNLQKQVLQKVSDNPDVFEKEVKKSQGWLIPKDFQELLHWVVTTFKAFAEKIKELFGDILASAHA